METLSISYLLGLVGTPFGIATACLIISGWLISRQNITGIMKVLTPWVVGIVLSVAMLLAGKHFNFGAYAFKVFATWQDWVVFGLVALSPGMISNGIYDSKILEWLLRALNAK